LVFLRLDSPELALERVAVRVAQGGHNVSEEVIQRRFAQGWRNFSELYRPLVDSWQLYDNSGEVPQLLDAGFNR
jgi:predicted ABC-type ATPase